MPQVAGRPASATAENRPRLAIGRLPHGRVDVRALPSIHPREGSLKAGEGTVSGPERRSAGPRTYRSGTSKTGGTDRRPSCQGGHRGHLAAPLWWRPPELRHDQITRGPGCQGDRLTSLVTWIAVDSRGPASVYIASDSRISWPSGTPGAPQWNHARKTYSATRVPHIMGYVGDVLFPALALPTVMAQLDGDLQEESTENAQERALGLVQAAWKDVPAGVRLDSKIAHCTRVGSGVNGVEFGVQVLHLPAGSNRWMATPLEVPTVSSKIEFLGSGRNELEKNYLRWAQPDGAGRDRTSRAVFSAFCDAVDSGKDTFTGGAPQLVGLYRKGPARAFGVHWNGKSYLHGTDISDAPVEATEYRNSRFERVDAAGVILDGAQRHASKPT